MIKIKVIASGDAFGSGGTHQTCFWIQDEQSNYLLDCGAFSVSNLKRYKLNIAEIDAVFISHLHGDHFGGIPFILTELAFSGNKLDKQLTIIGPCGIGKKVEQLQELLYPGSWEKVKACVNLIEHSDLASHNLPKIEYIRVHHSENLECFALKLFLRDKIISFSGDMEWSDKIIEISEDADLFICECYSFDQKIQGHISYSELESNLETLNCKRIVLTHLGESMQNNLDAIKFHCLKEGEEILI